MGIAFPKEKAAPEDGLWKWIACGVALAVAALAVLVVMAALVEGPI